MLFVQETTGQYRVAPKEVVLQEALRLSDKVLNPDAKTIVDKDTAIIAIGNRLSNLEEEHIGFLFLNACHHVLKWEVLFYGTVNSATAYPRVVLKKAIEYNAVSIIIAHNHPSGNATPSRNDILFTGAIIRALSMIDVNVLDHVIVGDEMLSFADTGQMARIRSAIYQENWERFI